MTTDAWQQCRDRAARLLGRGDAAEESRQQARLERARAALTQAAEEGDEEGRQLVARQSAAWQTRFEDLLESSPEQEARMRELLGFLHEHLPSAVAGTVTVDATATGRARQAVQGQGTQHNYFYGDSGAARPGVVLSTLIPPPSILVGGQDPPASLAARFRAGFAPGKPALALLHGPGGAGKSATARALAAELAPEFTDARLEVDLAGFTPGSAPRPAGAMLTELLRLAGFDGSDIPGETAGKSQLWRAWAADKKVLLLLDNARDAGQIEPLLPSSSFHGRCVVVVTSRNRLRGLDTTLDIPVELLEPEAAVELLVRVAGLDGDEASSDALAELARLCGYLPLALRPVGALLADLDAATLVRVMRSANRPLEQLAEVDQEAAAAFTVSYEALTADLQRTLRTCVWHPGPDFDAGSIGALAGIPAELATVQLVRLLQRSMLTALPHRRYVFHDLFLSYARQQLATLDQQDAMRMSRRDLYRHLARVVATVHTLLSAAADPTAGTGPFDNPEHARHWLEAAAGELVGAAGSALSDSWELGGDFAVRTAQLLYVQGQYERSAALYEQVRAAASEAGDERAHGRAVTALGDLARSTGRFDEADDLFRTALRTLGGVADTAGEADALRGLGESARARGERDEASAHFTEALARARQADDAAGQGYALTGLAHLARQRGDLDTAGLRFAEAAELQRRADDGVGLAYAVRGLGHVRRARRELQDAERCFRDAMALHQRAGNRFGQAYALTALGGVTREAGRLEEAAAHLDDALALHRATNDRTGQARTHTELAALADARGDDVAARHHETAAASLLGRSGGV
ncbi:tetratricopeptide repeat protein [Streptomyces sp. SID14515]|uniref:tetratricopeptide repeat protein n=1 Tax=Streptomyces sp. SID14515 TaxID=2706074 RepID=UPI0019422090|nr:tetratricopeptide repeat protein [Streptomyces sp. SID14515]